MGLAAFASSVSAGMSPFTFHLFSVPLITFVWGLKIFRHSTAKGILAQASHCASALRRHEAPQDTIQSNIPQFWGLKCRDAINAHRKFSPLDNMVIK